MSAHDHRSPAAPIAGALAGTALRGLPAAGARAARGRRCARRSASRTAPPAASGFALTFDDGPHAAGHAGGARDPRPRARAGDVLPRRRAGAAQPRAGARDRRRRATRSACTATATATCCGWRRGRCARTSPARRTAIERRDRRARRRSTARPTACSTPPRCGSRARAAGARCCGATGAATGRRAPPPESIAARVTAGAGAGAVLLLHDADDYSAPGSWRRTAAALPRGARARSPRRGLHAVAP